MTPTVVYSQATSNSAGSVAVANNSAMVERDLRLCWISVSNTTVSTPGTGWDLLLSYTLASSRNGYIYRRTHAGAGESASDTFTFGAANNFSMVQAGVRGAGLGSLDFTPTSNSAATGTSLTATGATVLRPDSLLLVSYHHLVNTAGLTYSTPTGMSPVVTQAGTGTVGHFVGLFSETRAAGATGTRVTSSSGASNAWGATLLAVPAAVVLPGAQSYTSRRRAADW